jgi:DNA-binding transcriptional regulator LsrR (DeoR family)
VVGRFFAGDGTLIHYDKEPRLLAISAEQLQHIPHVIGIAVGTDKAEAILGAARAGLIDALVTDTVTARAVAALLE